MSKEYQQLVEQHAALIPASKKGDAAARDKKAEIGLKIRQMERESARAGRVLTPVLRQGRIEVDVTETSSRRSLQEEYVRQFDEKAPVEIKRRDGSVFRGTLRDYHRDRLLKAK